MAGVPLTQALGLIGDSVTHFTFSQSATLCRKQIFLCMLVLATVSPLRSTAKSVSADPIQSQHNIEAIIFSNLDKASMLSALAPYVAAGDSLKSFTKTTGLDPGLCFGSGPGVMHCSGMPSGLELVVNPRNRILLIRRTKRVVGGVDYPEMSITSNCLEYKGYTRCYPN